MGRKSNEKLFKKCIEVDQVKHTGCEDLKNIYSGFAALAAIYC